MHSPIYKDDRVTIPRNKFKYEIHGTFVEINESK